MEISWQDLVKESVDEFPWMLSSRPTTYPWIRCGRMEERRHANEKQISEGDGYSRGYVVPYPRRREDEEEDARNEDKKTRRNVHWPMSRVLQPAPKTKDRTALKVLIVAAKIWLVPVPAWRASLPASGRELGRRREGFEFLAAIHFPVPTARLNSRHEKARPKRPRGADRSRAARSSLVGLTYVESQLPCGF